MPAMNGSRTGLSSHSKAAKIDQRRDPERDLTLETHRNARMAGWAIRLKVRLPPN